MTKLEEADILIRFIQICANGAVRPYDHSHFLDKVQDNEDLKALLECCPPASEIRDAKAFKPYLGPALEKFAEVMGLDKQKTNRHWR